MLSPTLISLRLFLHILAASVWVGGQVVLIGVVPSIRTRFPEATQLVAGAYARLAWPAFALAVATGIWNIIEIDVADTTLEYQVTLFVKILLVTLSGTAVAIHQFGRSKLALALGGAIGFVAALGAMFVGYLLTTGA